MKKLFFVLAFVAVYGVSMAMSSSVVSTVDNSKSVVVAVDEKTEKADKEKEAKPAATEAKAKGEGCAAAKSGGCGDKAKADCGSKKEGTK
jgi:hypothetical protein